MRTYVHKVLINKQKRAFGVKYEKNGEIRIAKARKEVIVCGGGISTPPILMHSGIGPRQHLEEMGVSIISLIDYIQIVDTTFLIIINFSNSDEIRNRKIT
jgi:choline dehydrogenase-like flavoprotein